MLYQKHLSNQVQYRLHHPVMSTKSKKRLPSNEVIKDGYNSLLMKQGIDSSTGKPLIWRRTPRQATKMKPQLISTKLFLGWRMHRYCCVIWSIHHTLCDENAPKGRKKEAAKHIQRSIIPLIVKEKEWGETGEAYQGSSPREAVQTHPHRRICRCAWRIVLLKKPKDHR